MPITKTYLNKKTVAQVRGLATHRGLAVGKKTKPQLINAIIKYEAKKGKAKKSKPGGNYGSQKIIHKGSGKKTMVSLKTKSEHDKMVKKFRADGFKKVPLHTFIKK